MDKKFSPAKDSIQALLKALLEANEQPIKKLVTHNHPDDDAWACLWMAKRFFPRAKDAEIVFVNSGEILPGTEDNPSVLHFDTGLGKFDQHSKGIERGCSATLLLSSIDKKEWPHFKTIIDLAVATDNIDPLPHHSSHFVISGYSHSFKEKDKVDWKKVQERVFEIFDILYGQEKERNNSKLVFERINSMTILPNGIKVASILWNPRCREAAFEAGADVVIWTQKKGNRFYTGIQSNRKYPVYLDKVVSVLRIEELFQRKDQRKVESFHAIIRSYDGDPWFLHDSKRLILNGSYSHELKEGEFTVLSPDRIVGKVQRALSNIPVETVSSWRE